MSVKTKRGKLKPCPYCGCEMTLEKEHMIDGITIRFTPIPKTSHKRGCQLEFASRAYVGNPTTVKAATAKWNRRTNSDWISCKDSLPEKSGRYLVVYHNWSDGNYLPKYDDYSVKVMHYQVNDLATGYSGWNYAKAVGKNADLIEADQHREVTHWQYLPELPQVM